MSTEAKIAELRAEYLEELGDWFDGHLDACESPIEKLFLAFCLYYGWKEPGFDDFPSMWDACAAAGLDMEGTTIFAGPGWDDNVCLVVQPSIQLPDRKCRLDFAIVAFGEKLAIELDGHDFHERTKEQAERDKSRDRGLTALGWKPLRFTGSEIYRDPRQAHSEIRQLIRDARRRRDAVLEGRQAKAAKS